MPTPALTETSIVVTGDDFGRSPEVNEAIIAYHRAGALHQASLMVAEPEAATAAALARKHAGLCVGLHLTLCDGRATEPSALTDQRGRLISTPAAAGWRYAFEPRLRQPLQAEIRRQFERFAALGFPPTYWDGHTHLHLHPTIFRLTMPIAREFGFRRVRLVREPGSLAMIPWIFERLSRAAIPALDAAGIRYSDRVFGLRQSGRMTLDAWRDAIASAAGVTEIYFHPGAEFDPPSPDVLATLLRGHSSAKPMDSE